MGEETFDLTLDPNLDIFNPTGEMLLNQQRLTLLRHIRYQKELEQFDLRYSELHTQELKQKLKEVKAKLKSLEEK